MGNPTMDALSFILGALFNIYALIVAVRFVMQAVNADGYSPVAQGVIRLTDPLLLPLRKFIPSIRGYDVAALLLCFVVLLLKALVFKLLGQSDILAGFRYSLGLMAVPQLITYSLLSLLNLFFNIFIYSIIILAILSWVSPDPRNPMYALLSDLARPVLSRVRRFVPPLNGFDLSTLVAIIGLYALKILVIGNLAQLLF